MSNNAPQLPLFYASAAPLSSTLHAAWRLLPSGARFAADAPASPVSAGEFAAASRNYPVVFAADAPGPLALMGLEKANLFVEGDKWAEATYVPAYIRRYPFILIEAADKSGFALGIDGDSAQLAIGGHEGKALFENGEPSDLTRAALEFCRLFNDDHRRARLFCEALDEAGLLVERRADATLPDGRRLGVQGFRVVDVAKFQAMEDAKVVEWHGKGWLALVHYHLASLERFGDLLDRQSKRNGVAELLSSAVSETADKSAIAAQ